MLRGDGSEIPVEVALVPIRHDQGGLLAFLVSDISARERAQKEVETYRQRLGALTAQLLLVEERERRSLAVDLHDSLSQTIALMKIKLSCMKKWVHGKLRKSLDEVIGLVDETDRSARSIGSELSPPMLHHLGLEAAVRWLAEDIGRRYAIDVALHADGSAVPADEATRVILFRSIRELLINAAKHAGARQVHIGLERDEDHVLASVGDDGVGMDVTVANVATARGSGLLSIRERLGHLGGSMVIESAPGRGTMVRLSAPLANTTTTNAVVTP